MLEREVGRRKRHFRVRKTVQGSAAKPRLCVYRSLLHIYGQIIDDVEGKTIVAASSLKSGGGGNVAQARAIGKELGEKAIAAGIKQVVFDRGGYVYHGRVKALADGAREAGLDF